MADTKVGRGKAQGGAKGNGNGDGASPDSDSEMKNAKTERHESSGNGGDSHDELVRELKVAFEMELETVINYLANSVHLDGLLAQEVKESLKEDITEELGHAQQLAERLKILNADIPGSLAINFSQKAAQPPADSTDVLAVIKGVIEAENAAIQQYEKIIELADDLDDYVTEDMCIQILANEQHHKREFEGYLKSRERGSLK